MVTTLSRKELEVLTHKIVNLTVVQLQYIHQKVSDEMARRYV